MCHIKGVSKVLLHFCKSDISSVLDLDLWKLWNVSDIVQKCHRSISKTDEMADLQKCCNTFETPCMMAYCSANQSSVTQWSCNSHTINRQFWQTNISGQSNNSQGQAEVCVQLGNSLKPSVLILLSISLLGYNTVVMYR